MNATTPTGWADDRLMQALDLIEDVMRDQGSGCDAYALLSRIPPMIEAADIELACAKAGAA